MTIALWIIAIVSVIRAIQNHIQLMSIKRNASARDNAYAEFVKLLKQSDREFVRRMLEEFENSADQHKPILDEGDEDA